MKKYRKMEAQRYIKIDKNKYRDYHVSEFNELIRLLYPHRKSINKYESLLKKRVPFTEHQKQLILETAHSLTVINELYRDQDKYGRFYVIKQDLYTAIFMLQNELNLIRVEYLLTPVIRWYYRQIYYYYQNLPFTAKELRLRMQKSRTTIHQHLAELVDRNLIEITGQIGHAYIYQITDKKTK